MKVVRGSLYSAKVLTVLKSVRSMPEHLRSMHVTLCPELSRRVRILYQHQAPWPAPWTSTKCSCFEPERPLSLAIFSQIDSQLQLLHLISLSVNIYEPRQWSIEEKLIPCKMTKWYNLSIHPYSTPFYIYIYTHTHTHTYVYIWLKTFIHCIKKKRVKFKLVGRDYIRAVMCIYICIRIYQITHTLPQ